MKTALLAAAILSAAVAPALAQTATGDQTQRDILAAVQQQIGSSDLKLIELSIRNRALEAEVAALKAASAEPAKKP